MVAGLIEKEKRETPRVLDPKKGQKRTEEDAQVPSLCHEKKMRIYNNDRDF